MSLVMPRAFRDRVDAGRQLAPQLARFAGDNVTVLGLPRGGVPVAAAVAEYLNAPLDVIVVRKLGLPSHPEIAMGAIGEDGSRVLDRDFIARAGVSSAQVDLVERQERSTLESRLARFRGDTPPPNLSGRTAIIVDDGIATGATANVACLVARAWGAARVVVAAPVGGPDAAKNVPHADEVICLMQPADFAAVGAYYRDFGQTSDDEVVQLLAGKLGPAG